MKASARVGLLAAATLAVAAMATPAAAQPLDTKYWIELVGFWPKADTQVTISRPGFAGTEIDFERDLDIDKSQTLPDLVLGARFGRFTVIGEYLGLDRDGSTTLSRNIMFDGVTYPANAMLESEFKSNIYRLSVGYAFIRNEQAELGVSLGLHATDFEVGLSGNAQVGAGPGVTVTARNREFLAPLPVVGAYGAYQINPKVVINGRVDYLSLDVGDYDGGILNLQAAIAYRVTDLIEVGAGYNYVDYDLDVDKDNYQASVQYDFSGPSIFLRFNFR